MKWCEQSERGKNRAWHVCYIAENRERIRTQTALTTR